MFRTVPLSIIRSFSLYTANLYDIYHCCVCSEKLLMMDRRTKHTHTNTHTHTLGMAALDGYHPVAEDSTCQTHNIHIRDRHPCPRRDSNPRSQQASDSRCTPSTAQPSRSAEIFLTPVDISLFTLSLHAETQIRLYVNFVPNKGR